MNFIQAILEFLRQFMPLEKVMHFERGMLYMCGQLREKETWWCYGGQLEPRIYVVFPWLMEVHTVPVTPDILKLWNLCVSTKDNASLRIRANVRYEIFDAVKAYNSVQDYKDNLGDEARTNLARVVRERDYAGLLADQTTVEREAKNAMNAVVKEWGIKVIRVGITDFIKTKDISLANV